MNLLHMKEAPYRAVRLSSRGGLMGGSGWVLLSGGGQMPGPRRRTGRKPLCAAGASLCFTVWTG